tara:strand:- start:6 stop:1769 length:1764 start_codon:yes stop_codon:yes gene_type:complete
MKLLVTTALEETWGKDEDIVFLGEWCRLYSRRDSYDKRNHEVLPYHWDDRKKAYNDYKYLKLLNKKITSELKIILNALHGKDYSERIWSILIGHWLVKFTAVVFDRWVMIENAEQNYTDLTTNVLNIDYDTCVPNSSIDGVEFLFSDKWNHFLCSEIIKRSTNIEVTKTSNELQVNNIYDVAETSLKTKLKSKVRSVFSYIQNTIFRSGTYVFKSTYLSVLDQLKLNISLGLSVSNIDTHTPHIIDCNNSFRQWIINDNTASEFEKIVFELLPVCMPKTYLEGFAVCDKKWRSKLYINRTKVIFSSNSHYYDDNFKTYIMHEVKQGAKLILGQHGGGALNRYEDVMDLELLIADKYLSTGSLNTKRDKKIIDIGQLFNRQKYNKYDKNGGALLVTVAMPRYHFSLFSAVIAGQMLGYFEDQFDFYNSLTDEIKKQLNVRLYHGDYGWEQRQRWLDYYPGVKFDTNRKMDKSVQQSRLIIGTYAATTYNETLASNIPTIIYWNTEHWELSAESDLFFEELKRVGIFHTTPQSAAKQVVKIWNDIDQWWYDRELQNVREKYCRAFAYRPKDLVQRIKKVLVEEKDKYGS